MTKNAIETRMLETHRVVREGGWSVKDDGQRYIVFDGRGNVILYTESRNMTLRAVVDLVAVSPDLLAALSSDIGDTEREQLFRKAHGRDD